MYRYIVKMRTFVKRENIKIPKTRIFETYFYNMNPCVLDIETTGLSGNKSKIILIGILIPHSDYAEIIQFFSDSKDDERDMLNACLKILKEKSIDYLITYNGESFDIPFLKKRLEINGIDDELNFYSYDLHKFIKYFSDIEKMTGSLTQNELEKYMGISHLRKDSIYGKDIPNLYKNFINENDDISLNLILNHNLNDLIQLSRLLKSNIYIDLHGAINRYGFISNPLSTSITPRISRNKLILFSDNLLIDKSFVYFSESSEDISINIDASSKNLEIIQPLEEYNGFLYYDLNKLDYLPEIYDRLSFEELDGFESNYLILASDSQKKYREINYLSMLLLEYVLKKIELY